MINEQITRMNLKGANVNVGDKITIKRTEYLVVRRIEIAPLSIEACYHHENEGSSPKMNSKEMKENYSLLELLFNEEKKFVVILKTKDEKTTNICFFQTSPLFDTEEELKAFLEINRAGFRFFNYLNKKNEEMPDWTSDWNAVLDWFEK
jgi:hypothetical protein